MTLLPGFSVSRMGVPHTGFIEEPQNIELYQPFNVYPDKSSTSLNFKSEDITSPTNTPDSDQINEFNKLLCLMKEKIPSHLHMGLENLASKLKIPSKSTDHGFCPDVFLEGAEIQQSINHAVHILGNHNLTPKHRIWVLAVLQHLRGYFPKGYIKAMNTDMTQGPITFAALQIHMTKGI